MPIDTCYTALLTIDSRTAALYNIRSGSWLASANGTGAHIMRPSIAHADGQLDPRCS